jgi:hypothetical protein
MLKYFSLLFMSVVLCCVGRVYFIIFGPVAYGVCCAVCVLWRPYDALMMAQRGRNM